MRQGLSGRRFRLREQPDYARIGPKPDASQTPVAADENISVRDRSGHSSESPLLWLIESYCQR
jgi:hypothetical protein